MAVSRTLQLRYTHRPCKVISTHSVSSPIVAIKQAGSMAMADIRVITGDGGEAILESAAVQSFAEGLRGRLLQAGDGGYDEARRVWNGMIDRRPALIARCAGPADVMAAVRFARDHRLLVSVKGGGHNITGNAVCEGGLMIDLSPMKSVRVDPAGRTARAEAGLTWGEYNRETQAFGLASTGGVVSTTGIAGLTLGGGLGWLMGKHGLSCDNLLSADLVSAEGELLTASADQHPELFWGLRGGGGNFRCRHLVRVSVASGSTGAGRNGAAPDDPGQKGAAILSGFRTQLPGRGARRRRVDDGARRRPGRRDHRQLYRRHRGRGKGAGAGAQVRRAARRYDRAHFLRRAQYAVRRGGAVWRRPALLEIELFEGARRRSARHHGCSRSTNALADVDGALFPSPRCGGQGASAGDRVRRA